MCLISTSRMQNLEEPKTVYVMRTISNDRILSPCMKTRWHLGKKLHISQGWAFEIGDTVEAGVFHVFLTADDLRTVINSGQWDDYYPVPFVARATGKIIYGTLSWFDNLHDGMQAAGVTELELIDYLDMSATKQSNKKKESWIYRMLKRVKNL